MGFCLSTLSQTQHFLILWRHLGHRQNPEMENKVHSSLWTSKEHLITEITDVNHKNIKVVATRKT